MVVLVFVCLFLVEGVLACLIICLFLHQLSNSFPIIASDILSDGFLGQISVCCLRCCGIWLRDVFLNCQQQCYKT